MYCSVLMVNELSMSCKFMSILTQVIRLGSQAWCDLTMFVFVFDKICVHPNPDDQIEQPGLMWFDNVWPWVGHSWSLISCWM